MLLVEDSRTPVRERFATIRELVRELRKRTQTPVYGTYDVFLGPYPSWTYEEFVRTLGWCAKHLNRLLMLRMSQIARIHQDADVARAALECEPFSSSRQHPFLSPPSP